MKKNRVLASIVLTAGLGLSGVTTASASGTAPAQPDHGKVKGKRICVIVHKAGHQEGGTPEKVKVEFRDGKYYVNGKRVPEEKLPHTCGPKPPHLPGGGKSICVIHEPDGSRSAGPGRRIKDVLGRAGVIGKLLSRDDAGMICRHQGHGKGDHACVIVHGKEGGSEHGVAGRTALQGDDGKVRVPGKRVPGDKLPRTCPSKPPHRPGDSGGR